MPATSLCPATKLLQHWGGAHHWHRDTGKHTQGRKLWVSFFCLYSHLCHVYEALSLTRIISVPHPPTDNSPNPFRGKMQWLWLQSSSSISSSIAKLRTIKQPSISTLLVILLRHCKRKKSGVFGGFCSFFYGEAATVWRKPVLCTHVFHMVHCKLHGIESSWRKMAIEKWFSWASSVDLFCL